MPGAGDPDRRIVIERFTSTNNEFNEPVETWATYTTVWAQRKDTSDRERMETLAAGQIGSHLSARFVIRSSPTTKAITPSDRINYDGSIWSIFGIKETQEGRNRFLEITAAKDDD